MGYVDEMREYYEEIENAKRHKITYTKAQYKVPAGTYEADTFVNELAAPIASAKF